ncbi:MAG: hypothetical protein RL011_844 [Pseudomonadota bacterium]|jgi:chorismate mutase/prephenate dehydrogenase
MPLLTQIDKFAVAPEASVDLSRHSGLNFSVVSEVMRPALRMPRGGYMTAKLSDLRDQVRAIDDQLLELVARRLRLAEEIGQVKFAANLPIKDYKVEKGVLERSRSKAATLGIYSSLAEELSRLLIRYAVIAQDDDLQQRQRHHHGPSRKVTVVGGRGRMGRWISDFFDAFGDQVNHVDQPGCTRESRYPLVSSLAEASDSDIIVLSTPISATSQIIEDLTRLKTKALVFDICSLKTPLVSALRKAQSAGIRIGSVHPMFGPDADVLVGRNIMICQADNEEITSQVRALFESTTANITEVSLERHDELMSYVLGLSHLSNLVFADVLAKGKVSHQELRQAASTTFNSQLGVTIPVTRENSALYYEIQAENGYTGKMLTLLANSLGTYERAIKTHDKEAFVALMDEAKEFFDERPA